MDPFVTVEGLISAEWVHFGTNEGLNGGEEDNFAGKVVLESAQVELDAGISDLESATKPRELAPIPFFRTLSAALPAAVPAGAPATRRRFGQNWKAREINREGG